MTIDVQERIVLFIFLLFTAFAAATSPADTTRCFQSQTTVGKTVQPQKYLISVNDSIHDDTLYQNVSEEGYPLSYSGRLKLKPALIKNTEL
ncbi:hypothetical protein ACFSPU_04585 [Haoranjiania flava]|uniref:Uncharacterized protein n=1 Tax=Haoranjiania flava TaxID=1856322 RepID=A0AAE3INB1_9BACT|nr:hypothetical protein [Haoranjiania flava]MCU7694789.1 hypothetical protein [Haoranjiania flava]